MFSKCVKERGLLWVFFFGSGLPLIIVSRLRIEKELLVLQFPPGLAATWMATKIAVAETKQPKNTILEN